MIPLTGGSIGQCGSPHNSPCVAGTAPAEIHRPLLLYHAMLIFWGTKRTTRKQGLVADFCPLCREVRAFRLLRLGLASHIYFISFGQGKLTGHVIECTDCGLRLNTDPLKYAMFAAESKEAPIGLDELERLTFPTLRERYAPRLALEAQVQRTASLLGAEQRRTFLLEPLTLLSPGVEARYASSSTLDKPSGLGCFGTLLAGLALLILAFCVPETWKDGLALTAVVALALGTVYTLVQMALAPGRYLRTRTVPLLARALDPLEPTQQELQDCLARCATAGMKIGKKVKLPTLWAALEHRAARLVTA